MAKKHKNRERKYRRLGGSGELPESMVRKEVEQCLTEFGWTWVPTDSRRGSRGAPDIFAARGKVMLGIKCKRSGGQFGPGQEEWMNAIREAGMVAMVVSPENMPVLVRFLKNTA